ncbi:MAG: hypothetical protein NZ558_01935, partial [Blastocatellia bacterium]|nr:hypothetical protein [Blastocatellia bacterium]
PSDIPLSDRDVRVKMLNELGVQNAFDAVIEADIEGRNSRARRIDERPVLSQRGIYYKPYKLQYEVEAVC